MLHVEQLEGRAVPSTMSFSGGTLTYTGNGDGGTPQQVYFLDDGHGDVTVFQLGGGTQQRQDFSGVHAVAVQEQGSPDQIFYIFTAPVSNAGTYYNGQAEYVYAYIEGGASMTLYANPGIAAGTLIVQAEGDEGGGTFNAHFGAIAAGASVYTLTYNDGGAFNVNMDCNAAVAGLLHTYDEDFGPGGSYTLSTDGVVTGNVVDYVFSYSAGNSYSVTGTAEPGSTGGLQGEVLTRGTDPTTFNLYDDSGGSAYVAGYLIVPAANTNVHHTPSVLEYTY